MVRLIHGDALKTIIDLASDPIKYDAIITDPPYSSGGSAHNASASTATKYTNAKQHNPLPDFDGDTMDMRSWTRFMADVFIAARAICNPGAVCCAFINWCMLPSLTDALQRAGWHWLGIAVWDKTEASRPQRGRYRQQAEYIVWGSNGKLPVDRDVPVLPGVYRYPNVSVNKLHQVQKPLELMRDICKIVVPGGNILDPFAGSGTTLAAAQSMGYDCTGIESNAAIAAAAEQRLGIKAETSRT